MTRTKRLSSHETGKPSELRCPWPGGSFLRGRKKWIAPLLCALFMCTPRSEAEELKKATFIPQWVPQAQFAGYYVALERGIYKKHGIDLTIVPGGPDSPSDELLESGKVDFASLWLSTAIAMRARGVKVVNIAQMMQRSALMLIAKKAIGIKEPRDINGKKVGLWGPIFQVQPRAFFKKYDLHVREVRQSYSVNLFLRDGVDVASAMWYNEYHTIINSGLDPDELATFFFHEHGLNFPEDGIYTLEDNVERGSDLCKAFVKASAEGWKAAFANPHATIDIVMKNLKQAHIPATRVHQMWMLQRMMDLILPEGGSTPTGRLFPEDYERACAGLRESGLIKRVPLYAAFYRECKP
jgi:NitT/TauT family transport system substrate-binding protein